MPSCSFRLPVCLLCIALPALAGASLKGLVLPYRQVEVSATVSSRVVDLKVGEGDAVKAGQPLAQLYGRLEELEMQRAKVLLDRREFEARGAKRLFDSKVIPEARALESRIDLDLARLQYETAVEQVRLRTIVAPVDGVVVARHREVGEAVAAAQPMFRLVDLSRVLVECAAAPADLALLVPGRKVRVRLLQQGGLEALGEVALVDPCADAEGKVRIRVVVENPEGRIRSGFQAEVLLPAES